MTHALVPEPGPAPGDPQTPGPVASSVSGTHPPRCPTRTRVYRDGRLVAEGFPAEDIAGHLAAGGDVAVWLDLFDPDAADLQIVVEEFGLHPLAVEDAIHDHQRPKLDRYRTHQFANMYAVGVDAETGDLTTSEISAFITPRALITVRKSPFDVDTLQERWDDTAELAGGGVGYLVYGLLDAVVDGQSTAVLQLAAAVDELEDALFDPQPGTSIRRRGFALRKNLAQLRRVVAPMGEVVGRVFRSDTHLADEALMPYFQDVHDHVLRAAEGVETARDLVSDILETDFNEQGNQLNEITKKLAAWAAIIAVPTAVTGYYGQNVPYPGFAQHWGFVISTIVIVLLSGGLYWTLRRRGWL